MTTEISALDGWLAVHPYLGEVAKLQQAIDAALDTDDSAPLPALQWDSLSGDFEKGIPFFKNRELDEAVITRAAELLCRLAQTLSAVRHKRRDETGLCVPSRPVPKPAGVCLHTSETGNHGRRSLARSRELDNPRGGPLSRLESAGKGSAPLGCDPRGVDEGVNMVPALLPALRLAAGHGATGEDREGT